MSSRQQQEVAAALPDYEIGGELGRGAWGIVLAGRHRRLRRAVAIKQLPPALTHDPDVRARFASEARLLASLDHPHIVPVYDYVERDELCLLVMEQLSGGTVWDRFKAGRMDARSSCAVALVTAAALAYAHSRGVLHRDIKPENLLLAADGRQVKVADFGIAKVLGGDRTQSTTDGQVLGTPSYMAPEQARGLEATPATDVYALGSTLYRLLSGRLPFPDAATPLAAMYQRVHEDPRDLRTIAPDVPAVLAVVVMRSLEREPARRHSSAEQFATELAAAATTALGAGWLASTSLRAVLGGRVAALAENAASQEPPAPSPATPARAADAAPAADAARRQASAGDAARAETRAHELREIRLLEDIRAGKVPLRPEEGADAVRLLGGDGVASTERLGLPRDASAEEIRVRAVEQAQRWRRRSENPLSPRSVVTAAQLLVRTCEGLAADG